MRESIRKVEAVKRARVNVCYHHLREEREKAVSGSRDGYDPRRSYHPLVFDEATEGLSFDDDDDDDNLLLASSRWGPKSLNCSNALAGRGNRSPSDVTYMKRLRSLSEDCHATHRDLASASYRATPWKADARARLLKRLLPPCLYEMFSSIRLPENFTSHFYGYPGGVDAVFVIHYARLIERKKYQTTQLQRLLGKPPIWVEWFDRDAMTLDDYCCGVTAERLSESPKWSKKSLILKQFFVLYLQLKYGLCDVMVLEDDAMFLNATRAQAKVGYTDFRSPASSWNLMMGELPSDYDFLFFSQCRFMTAPPTPGCLFLTPAGVSRCAGGYLSSIKAAYNMLLSLPIASSFDHQMNLLLRPPVNGTRQPHHAVTTRYLDPNFYYTLRTMAVQGSEMGRWKSTLSGATVT